MVPVVGLCNTFRMEWMCKGIFSFISLPTEIYETLSMCPELCRALRIPVNKTVPPASMSSQSGSRDN